MRMARLGFIVVTVLIVSVGLVTEASARKRAWYRHPTGKLRTAASNHVSAKLIEGLMAKGRIPNQSTGYGVSDLARVSRSGKSIRFQGTITGHPGHWNIWVHKQTARVIRTQFVAKDNLSRQALNTAVGGFDRYLAKKGMDFVPRSLTASRGLYSASSKTKLVFDGTVGTKTHKIYVDPNTMKVTTIRGLKAEPNKTWHP
jgi:hypothetical protein